MATIIYDGVDKTVSIKKGEEQWFYVNFSSEGKANFYVNPNSTTLDVDLYVYSSNKTTLLGKATSGGVGEHDVIMEIPVESNKRYYIKVKAYSGSGTYLLRCKNYEDDPIIPGRVIKIPGMFDSFNQRNSKYVPSLDRRCYECALACAVSYELQQKVSPNDLVNTATYDVNTINKSDPEKMVNAIIASIDEGIPVLAHYYKDNYNQHWSLVYGYNTDIFTIMDFSDKYKIFDTYNCLYVKDSVTEKQDIGDDYGYDTTLAKAMALSINYSQNKKYLSETINECRYVTNVKLK